jgi:hypothetical protein
MLKHAMLFAAILCVFLGASPASAEKRETIIRPNTKGQPQSIPRARNFRECVAGGMALGYPRVGPGGLADPAGAEGFCLRRWPR